MDILAPLGFPAILRAMLFGVFSLFIPGYLFLRLGLVQVHSRRLLDYLRIDFLDFEHEEGEPLFEGHLEKAFASIAFSVIISSLVFVLLTFSVGLNFFTALLGLAAVILTEAYLLWKEKR